MSILRNRNTKEHGTVEFLVYKEGETYIGVCLTFDIVEEGKNPVDLMTSLKEAAALHLETVAKENLSEDLLNRYAPQEYWEKFFEAGAQLESRPVPTSFPSVSPYSSSFVPQLAC